MLALGTVDFKRHNDIIAYFDQNYVATEIFSRELGRRLGMLKQLREKSDYDDFYVASKEQAKYSSRNSRIDIKQCSGIFGNGKRIVDLNCRQ